LIVDDSASVRRALTEVLEADPAISVMGAAGDPYAAARYIQKETPDVITLDVEMPRMDGVTFLRKLMRQHPVPVVMCSSLTEEGSETLMQAMAAGAVDVILKPRMGARAFLEESRVRICEAVKAAAHARLRPLKRLQEARSEAVSRPEQARPRRAAMARTTEKVVCIGASTGGTESLRSLLETMPADAPPMAIVQHMPELFTRSFAARLDKLCSIEVVEAEDGMSLLRGRAVIAQGNRHLSLTRSGARYTVRVQDGPLVSRHRPSVNVLFRSAAHYAGANAIGVIMTGMGDDGAEGLKAMRDAGAHTIGQDEATSVVFGMAREAQRLGAVAEMLPLDRIGQDVLRATKITA
jgi:two-component system chemotaxis response regulator CheB